MNTSNSRIKIGAYLFTSLLISSNVVSARHDDTSFVTLRNSEYSLYPNQDFDTSDKIYTFNKKKTIKERYRKIAQSAAFKSVYQNKSVGDLMLIDE